MGMQKWYKHGHLSSSPSTKHPVTMATDQSQTINVYSWIAKMSYYYYGEC